MSQVVQVEARWASPPSHLHMLEKAKQKQLPRVGEKPALALAWTATGPTLCREKGGEKKGLFPDE